MSFIEKNNGFTALEFVVVAAVMGILLAMAAGLASRFADRRSIDKITTNISTTLQIVKMKAARHGVEYQAVIDYDEDKNLLTIRTERGNSNRGSDVYVELTSQDLKVFSDVTIIPTTERAFNFNPNGTLGGASGSISIKPNAGSKKKRCGKIIVSPFGRIRVIQGNLIGPNTCRDIRDDSVVVDEDI